MNNKLFLKLIRFDIETGILVRWKWYLISAFLFAVQWSIAHNDFNSLPIYFSNTSLATYMDYVFHCFKGMKPFQIITSQSHFIIPTEWTCVLLGSLVCSLGWSGIDVNAYTIQLLLRGNSRVKWWLSKCCCIAVSTLVYSLIGYVTILLLCIISSSDLSMQTSIYSEISVSSSNICLECGQVTPQMSILIGIILPVLVMICLNLFQLVLRLYFVPAISFLCCLFSLIISAYFKSPLLIGNYAMVSRSNVVIADGVNPYIGLLFLLVLDFIIILVGLKRVLRFDFLIKEVEKCHGN